jgi:hypothetical protein
MLLLLFFFSLDALSLLRLFYPTEDLLHRFYHSSLHPYQLLPFLPHLSPLPLNS